MLPVVVEIVLIQKAFRIELVQSLSLGFEVCLRVQVRRVKMRVTNPTVDDGNVHTCRDQVNGR